MRPVYLLLPCVNEREGGGMVRLQGVEVEKVDGFKYLGSTACDAAWILFSQSWARHVLIKNTWRRDWPFSRSGYH